MAGAIMRTGHIVWSWSAPIGSRPTAYGEQDRHLHRGRARAAHIPFYVAAPL
jgi:hypothetical protein